MLSRTTECSARRKRGRLSTVSGGRHAVLGGLGGSVPVFKSRKDTLPNPLIMEYERRNKRITITYSFQPVLNANLKWKDLPSIERHAYCEKLEMMKLEYIYEGDRDVFVDYSWERALSIDNEIYPEWVLEFFSTL
ncbi:hypothetical protein Tco_1526316 [Tanacetum coccineum]